MAWKVIRKVKGKWIQGKESEKAWHGRKGKESEGKGMNGKGSEGKEWNDMELASHGMEKEI
jgi:hypothetical protein